MIQNCYDSVVVNHIQSIADKGVSMSYSIEVRHAIGNYRQWFAIISLNGAEVHCTTYFTNETLALRSANLWVKRQAH